VASALPEVLRWAALSAAACAEWPPTTPALQLADVQVESGGDPTARSPAGAEGLEQLMPATAAGLGVRDAYDPGENLRGGAHYLSDCYRQFRDWAWALMAYNAGPGNAEAVRAAHGTDWASAAARDWGWAPGQQAGVVAYVDEVLALEPVYAAALRSPPVPAPAPRKAPPLPMLEEGDSGAAVRVLQALLARGTATPITVDGVFGPVTAGAVTAAKRRLGLPATNSVVGPRLWGALAQTL
jgi:hypothetical protein